MKLSEPQELQMAIDSNKRDRRHSENMDFMTPQLQRDIDPTLSPVVTTASPAPQGLLISSPTMALPHTSLPPYSGGFIVTGGPGGTQLVQMAPHMPGIPIVMPSGHTIPVSNPSQATPLALSNHAPLSEDKDEVQSHTSGDGMDPPPAKKPAPEPTHLKVSGGRAASYSIHQTSTGNFIMAHGGVASSGVPQLLHMGGSHGQIPIVVPTGPVSSVREQQKCPVPPTLQMNGKSEGVSKPEPLPIGALPSHGAAGAGIAVLNQRSIPATTAPSHTARSLLMTHHPNVPGLIIPQPIGALPNTAPQNGEEKRKNEQEKAVGVTNPAPGVVKMPFANISIQPGEMLCLQMPLLQ